MHSPPDPSTMSDEPPSIPIRSGTDAPEPSENTITNGTTPRRTRPTRACTVRSAARLYEVELEFHQKKTPRKVRPRPPRDESPPPSPEPRQPLQYSRIVTPLVGDAPESQVPRWNIRAMWELASILNFFNVFRPLLNINVEFSAEEFEAALITPNSTLAHIHIPLLKAIPPIARMAHGQNTWVTVLCRKLREWWHWVADGEVPIVASHGAEVEAYNMLDPGVRVVILKAICDIRVEQEDIRNYIDDSIKHGAHLSAFRKERTGGDSNGISFWYEDDPIIGQRLYREIREVEVQKGKGKSIQPTPSSCYRWETVATSLDEFEDVSEKLFSSKNRTEASLGKKLKIDMLPEIEKVHKRKERLLKKQQREALLLDNMISVDVFAPGRSLRGRKPVSYTFDDYDRSINEAIEITKRKELSPEPTIRRDFSKPDATANGSLDDSLEIPNGASFNVSSPDSPGYEETDEDRNSEPPLDRSNRRRQRPQRYSAREFSKPFSDDEAESESDDDDDIVGEAVYDEEYVQRQKKRRRTPSSSEGDEEYHWDGDNAEDEEEEEEDDDDEYSSNASEESDEPQKFKKLRDRTRRGTKSRSVGNVQSGLRRSNRATRNRIDYKQYELSESEAESGNSEKSNDTDNNTDASDNAEFTMVSQDSGDNDDNLEMKVDQPVEDHPEAVEEEQNQQPQKLVSPERDEDEVGVHKRRFLDLNELAPGSGFDDGPNSMIDDDDRDNF